MALNKRINWLKQNGAAIYFTDASFDSATGDGAIALHSPTRSVDTMVRYTNAPTCTVLEEFSIAAAIEYAVQVEPPETSIFVFSDSQEALRNMARHDTHPHTTDTLHCALRTYPPHKITLVWVPGHANLDGNARAHALTRELSPGPSMLWPSVYHPGTQHALDRQARRQHLHALRDSRRCYPVPHSTLSREAASMVRQAQTSSLLTPSRIHYIHGILSRPTCPTPNCPTHPSVRHLYWECRPPDLPPHLSSRITSWEDWLNPGQGVDVKSTQELLAAHCLRVREGLLETYRPAVS